MQIVANIDDNLYTRLFDNGDTDAVDMQKACAAIRKGTPLPKGHGRLIDADVLQNDISHDKREAFTKHDVWLFPSIYNKRVPTIIEADKEETTWI